MQSLNISSSALRGIQQALDKTANNLSNLDTVGYKRQVASFSELLADSINEQPAEDRQNRDTPVGIRVGSGARLGMTKLDMSQGSMKETNVPTDLMIQGDGYYMVGTALEDANGGRTQEYRLTRDGSFHLERDDVFYGGFVLVSPTGDLLLNESGSPLVFGVDKVDELVVSTDGYVFVNGEPTNERIGVWKVDNPDELQQLGENLLDAAIEDGELPGAVYEQSWTNDTASIRQGALEASNVVMQEEMSELINIQRAYQLNSRAIAIGDQMMGIATSIRSR
jgi:flagellar basal-body rod protein FlgG